MPKIVDHDQRRAEIAQTAERVLVREGWHGITMRGIAAQTGWSTGSVRHYFPNQHALRSHVAQTAARLLREQIGTRVLSHSHDEPVIERVAAIVEELLPLDDQRRYEYALWEALVEWERDQPAELHSTIWNDQRALYRRCIATLTHYPHAADTDPPRELDERREVWTGYLHVFIDGLAAQMTHTPDKTPPHTARALLRSFLTEATRTEQRRAQLSRAPHGPAPAEQVERLHTPALGDGLTPGDWPVHRRRGPD